MIWGLPWSTGWYRPCTQRSSRERTRAGHVSAMYAGAECIAKPMPTPYVTRPASRMLYDGATYMAAAAAPTVAAHGRREVENYRHFCGQFSLFGLTFCLEVTTQHRQSFQQRVALHSQRHNALLP